MSKLRDGSWHRGDLVELRFWMEASRRGVIVSRPHARARYDFIVDCGNRLWRVQVKSTTVVCGRNGWKLSVTGLDKRRPYTPKEVDFIAAYVIPKQHWYIFPLSAVRGHKVIILCEGGRMDRYRDAWHLLLNKPKGARINIEAAASER